MSRYHCTQEQKILEAVRSGEMDASLSGHASTCPICADVALVARFFCHAELDQPDLILPDAGLLLWKAQLRTRDAALARATRPIDLVTKAGFVAVGLAGLWTFSTSPAIREWIVNFFHSRPLQYAGSVYWGEFALLIGVGTIVCALLGSLLALRA